MGIDSNMQISFYVGSDGYGPDHPSVPSLLGSTVQDADLSFWGGAILKPDGTVTAWGPDTVYCSSATSISCQPTSSNPTAVDFRLTSVPAGTTMFTGLSCGGKRGGHWCCAYQTGVVGLTCFGDSRGEYTPSSAELNQVELDIYQIATGVDYIAVLGTSGQLGVYGSTSEIGNGLSNANPSSLASLTMGSVYDATEKYIQVSTMNFAIYALKSDGALHAWGKSYSYSVGGGGSVDMAALVPDTTFGQLSSGSAGVYAHYCALKFDNVATCWGADYSGQVSGAPTSAISTVYIMPDFLGNVSSNSTTIIPDAGTPTTTLDLTVALFLSSAVTLVVALAR